MREAACKQGLDYGMAVCRGTLHLLAARAAGHRVERDAFFSRFALEQRLCEHLGFDLGAAVENAVRDGHFERLADRGAGARGETRQIEAPLGKIPVLQRGGSVVPRQMRPRRSSALMREDPYTLVVALDAGKRAQGSLYLDDGGSLDFRRGGFRLRQFDYAPEGSAHVLRSTAAAGGKSHAPANTVERILVAGLNRRVPTSVECVDGEEGGAAAPRAVAFSYDEQSDVLTIRKPDLKVAYSWSVRISF